MYVLSMGTLTAISSSLKPVQVHSLHRCPEQKLLLFRRASRLTRCIPGELESRTTWAGEQFGPLRWPVWEQWTVITSGTQSVNVTVLLDMQQHWTVMNLLLPEDVTCASKAT